jgi:hypothetical protein
MTLEDVRRRLDAVSGEITALIRKYKLTSNSSLTVISAAKNTISDRDDYIKFLELSLEGRILADEGERLTKVGQMLRPTSTQH